MATLGSLACRLEPQLLRRLRLALAPTLDAGAEAALWFSPDLVALRAPTGLVLSPAALPGLREALAREPARLETAWTITATFHAKAAAALRLEEELTYLALKGLEQPAIEARARDLLRSALRTLLQRGGGLPAWADRALERLPAELLGLDEAQMIAYAAALRLGRSGPLAAVAAAVAGADWSWLVPSTLRRIPICVTWVDGGLEFGPPGAPGGHLLDLPALMPLALHVWPDGPHAGAGDRVPVHPLRRNFFPTEASRAVIQVLGGERVELRLRVPPQRNDKLRHVRRPRTRITYEIEAEGGTKTVELPFVVGVLGDFAPGNQPLPQQAYDIDRDNFDGVLSQMAPRLELHVPNRLAVDAGELRVELSFTALSDFEPDYLARAVPEIARVLDTRATICQAQLLCDRDTTVAQLLADLIGHPADDPDGIGRMIDAAMPSLGRAERMAIQLATTTIRATPVEAHDGEPGRAFQTYFTGVDRRLSEQVRAVMRHPAFASLESSWRGLHYLVVQSETSQSIKIRVINCSKSELAADLASAGDPDRSDLHKILYQEAFDRAGGEPYGALVGDYAWDASDQDVRTLRAIAHVAAECHAPFLTAAAPALLAMTDWQELSHPRDLARLMDGTDFGAWRAMRDMPESNYLTLTLPRVLARLPFGQQTIAASTFAFEEVPPGEAGSTEADDFCWMNAAFPLATRMTNAFATSGACIAIRGAEGGGRVEGLPTFTFVSDDGDVDALCPTEIGITDRRDLELSTLGLTPLLHFRNTDYAVFMGARSVSKPAADANEAIASRLPFVMTSGRFMQNLKVMVRDKIGSFQNASDVERWLNRWIANYVSADEIPSAEMQARYPLREARIAIEADGGQHRLVAYMRPWLGLEELTTSMRVEATLPSF